MPTIIDSLLVTLGLDAKGFTQGKNQVDKGLKDTAKTGEESFKRIAKSALEFFAVIGGTYEIKRFIQNQIEASAALDRLSKNLNESANSISAWSNSAELAGGSAQGLQGTMDMLSRAQTEVQLTGQSGLIPYFSALGLSLADASGKAKPVSDLLLELSDRFGHMNRTTANNLGRMMGVDQGTMNLLLKGRGEVELYIKRQKEYGAVTDAQAAEGTRLRNSMIGVQQTFEAFGRELLQDASPALEKMFEIMQSFGTWCHENKQFIEGFLTVVAAGIGAIAIAALPINLTAVALSAFGVALSAAWQDYEVWKNGGESLFNWAPAVNAATAAFNVLKGVVGTLLYRLGHVGAALAFLAHGDWSDAGEMASLALSERPTVSGAAGGSDRSRFIAAAADSLGVPPAAIDAQLRLETGATGSKTIGNYNYGNIKADSGYSGGVVSKSVTEYGKNGQSFQDLANFRSYTSPEAAASDYAAMIAHKFPGAKGAKNAADFARGLQAGGYATDPDYVRKIATIAFGIRGASSAAAGAGASHALAGQAGPAAGNQTVETNIGAIHVNAPNATDATGISKDIGKSLDYLFTSQANYGLR